MARSFYSKIVGVTYKNADGSDRQKLIKRCQVGEALFLLRDEENQHDSNAVAVCRKSGEQLGHLSREVAVDVAAHIESGGIAIAEIIDLTGGGLFSGKSRGVNIRVHLGSESDL